MGWFGCEHTWRLVAKTFAEPREVTDESLELFDGEYYERCRAGVTTVLMVCDDCGKKDVTEMLGKESPKE